MDNEAGVETLIGQAPCDDDDRPRTEAKDGNIDAGVAQGLETTNGVSVIQYDKPLKRHGWMGNSHRNEDNSISSDRHEDSGDRIDDETRDIKQHKMLSTNRFDTDSTISLCPDDIEMSEYALQLVEDSREYEKFQGTQKSNNTEGKDIEQNDVGKEPFIVRRTSPSSDNLYNENLIIRKFTPTRLTPPTAYGQPTTSDLRKDQSYGSIPYADSALSDRSENQPVHSAQSLFSRCSRNCAHNRSDTIREVTSFQPPTPRDLLFNVSGQYYRIDQDLLDKYPDTLLGCREKRARYWDADNKLYFLDRQKATFEVIIQYYINDGMLDRPDDIPIDIFINEIKFYCLDRENIVKFLSIEGILLTEKQKDTPDTAIKTYIWNLFEDPESCRVAKVVTTLSAMVIAISVIVFCMETVPTFESLGNESIQHISPALGKCQHYLCKMPQYYYPNGTLFSGYTIENNDQIEICSGNASLDSLEEDHPRTRRSDSNQNFTERAGYDGIAKTQYDNINGLVLLSTMRETLSVCAANDEASMLSRYTYLRCKSELADYDDNERSLLDTLSELELHSHHEDSEEEEKTSAKSLNTQMKTTLKDTASQPHSNLVGIIDGSVSGNRTNITKSARTSSRKHKPHHIRSNHTRKHGRVSKHGVGNLTVDSSNVNKLLFKEDEPRLMTLQQTIRGLKQLCHKLDSKSIRSSYHWLALEATLGGVAGQLFLIESACIVWFVIEILLRVYSCPSKRKFCTNFLNVIDAIAIMPYFITLIVTSLHTDSNLRPQTATILRTIRLVRMLRILKLSRHSRGLRILGLTLVRSTRVLVLLICFQMVLAVTFSSIVYYVEYDAAGTKFTSIPSAFWWAIITMTTVGYGDVVPVTTLGKITGAFCAIMGILGIAFPVPVIVSNFNYLYNLDSDACKLTPEELMGDEQAIDNDRNNNVEKFQENLFDAVRRNAGSMTAGPQEGQPTGQNPAELWNYARRQYFSDKKRPTKSAEPDSKHKFAKGIVAIATASAITVGLPSQASLSSKDLKGRKSKATSI